MEEILDIQIDEPENKDNFKAEVSVISLYAEDLTAKDYVTNPAIARESELKKMLIVLLTPEKSALLVGKPGIGKTAIVEGLAYLIKRNEVPDAIKGYKILKVNSSALVGTIRNGEKEELIMNLFVEEAKRLTKTIVFIDEIHTLIGTTDKGNLDLANMLKPIIDRGDLKVIGATTTIEYNTYIIRDRAFLRRFEKIDVEEPNEPTTVKILMGSLPKIEKQTGAKFRYNEYISELLVKAIVKATSEYKRIYGLAAMYPDVAFSVLTAAFSQAVYQNRNEVTLIDVYNAIKTSKRIYPDSIVKELNEFREEFSQLANEEGITLPVVTLDEVKHIEDAYY